MPQHHFQSVNRLALGGETKTRTENSHLWRTIVDDLGALDLSMVCSTCCELVVTAQCLGYATQTEHFAHVVWLLRTHWRVQFERFVGEPLQITAAILLGSKWSCLCVLNVLQARCIERSVEGVSAAEAESFRGRYQSALMERHNKKLPGIEEEVLKSRRREVEETFLRLSITEGGKARRARWYHRAAIWKRSVSGVQ